MKIEEAIKQSAFKSEAHRATINILYTAAHINALHNKIFKEYGISAQQYNVLRIVKGQHPNPASVQLINERMIDPASNVSRIVDKLVEKSLVLRNTSKMDRRQVDITLSKHAPKLIEKVAEALEVANEGLFEIPENNLQSLNETLDQYRIKTKNNK